MKPCLLREGFAVASELPGAEAELLGELLLRPGRADVAEPVRRVEAGLDEHLDDRRIGLAGLDRQLAVVLEDLVVALLAVAELEALAHRPEERQELAVQRRPALLDPRSE